LRVERHLVIKVQVKHVLEQCLLLLLLNEHLGVWVSRWGHLLLILRRMSGEVSIRRRTIQLRKPIQVLLAEDR
jgi:hypothetical protein